MRTFLLVLLTSTIVTPLAATKRPNVLFIAVDDWIGCFGGNQAKTPSLDRLAKHGTVFRNAHTSAVYCAPSRTSLMTGLNPHTTGCYYDEPHLASVNYPDVKDLPIWCNGPSIFAVTSEVGRYLNTANLMHRLE
jgi:hypothetical protein